MNHPPPPKKPPTRLDLQEEVRREREKINRRRSKTKGVAAAAHRSSSFTSGSFSLFLGRQQTTTSGHTHTVQNDVGEGREDGREAAEEGRGTTAVKAEKRAVASQPQPVFGLLDFSCSP
ncbi:hypothetical protein BVRB_7g164460 [Beta vulgaris subsp. vulgaris]|nr:hypothetical protein BVRB_7g164460 [Beta vulgaris subsp. vulgaris]